MKNAEEREETDDQPVFVIVPIRSGSIGLSITWRQTRNICNQYVEEIKDMEVRLKSQQRGRNYKQ